MVAVVAFFSRAPGLRLRLRMFTLWRIITSTLASSDLASGFVWIVAPGRVLTIAWLVMLAILSRYAKPGAGLAAPAASLTNPDPCAVRKDVQPTAYFTANRKMTPNYRIGETDLDWRTPAGVHLGKSQYLGMYLGCAVSAGDAVVPEFLQAQPVVKASAGKASFLLPFTIRFNSSVNAGSTVDLFDNNYPVLRKVAVLAVQCEQQNLDSCAVILDLGADEAVRLMRSDASKLNIVAVSP